MDQGKVILIIMDGWGIAENPAVSAIDNANTPFYNKIREKYPNSQLLASEEAVGLPRGQMGNSEVGHMNIGAGRIVNQELARISKSIDSGEFAQNENWKALLAYCRQEKKPLHLLGLVSNGGVHSHIHHLKGILRLLAKEADFPPVYIHCFTDGRDCDPKSGLGFIRQIEKLTQDLGTGSIATVIGRYFAMDRNQRWDRIKKTFFLLVHGKGSEYKTASEAIEASYAAEVTDEFIQPCIINPDATIQDGDAVFFFNFRTDRGRQLTTVLTQEDMHEFNMHLLNLHYVTMTSYDEKYRNVHVIFEKDSISHGLGETLAMHGKKQIRIAETEKYPHVTFFFNGGRETPFEGELRILCPSPKVSTYDKKPEMSASEIRDKIIAELEKGEVDFVCLNFANPDMVGHTGVFEAAIKACETVDACTEAVAEAALKNGYTVLITADHGNADKMINEDGSPHTAHTTAPVPFVVLTKDEKVKSVRNGKLGDIAPTVLFLMGLPQPKEMTGENLAELK
jgi:2,3-bisphosphoglycerate-independent phosphoglycerate mutase